MNGFEKFLGLLAKLPLWVMAAAALVAGAALLSANLQAGLPAGMRRSLPLVVVVFATASVLRMLAWVLARWRADREQRRTADRRQLKFYGGLATLFVTRHLTAASGENAPHLRHRVENAWGELFGYRRPLAGLRNAWRALGDRQASTCASIEYGGDFPLDEILSRVLARPVTAGPILMGLARRADRSRYEDGPRTDLLTDEEVALFNHIHAEYGRLAKQFA